jgi:hypothetical protein
MRKRDASLVFVDLVWTSRNVHAELFTAVFGQEPMASLTIYRNQRKTEIIHQYLIDSGT